MSEPIHTWALGQGVTVEVEFNSAPSASQLRLMRRYLDLLIEVGADDEREREAVLDTVVPIKNEASRG